MMFEKLVKYEKELHEKMKLIQQKTGAVEMWQIQKAIEDWVEKNREHWENK